MVDNIFLFHSLMLTSIIPKQLKSLNADSERSKLMKKLSEANQQNRFLKRQVCVYSFLRYFYYTLIPKF